MTWRRAAALLQKIRTLKILHAAVPLLPLAVVVGLAASGLAVLDYHANLVLAPATCLTALILGVQSERPGYLRALGLPLLAPLALLLALSPWQPGCDTATGLTFWLLGPASAALCGMALGTVARWLAGRRPMMAMLLSVLITFFTCVPAALAFLTQPQVFGVAMPTGWVAGALYEDAVAPTWSYVAYRLLDLAWCGPVIAVDGLLARPTHLRVFLADWRAPRLLMLLGLAATALAVGLLRAEPEGWRLGDSTVLRDLPVVVEVPEPGHAEVVWRVHAPAGPRWLRPTTLLVADVRFRQMQLRQWFGRLPGRVDIFAWPDADTKRRGMGAHRVEMAKPWLRQINLVLPEFGASVLTHELAHVVAGAWADNPLHVPLRHGWLPDALTIEGMAVAAEWPMRGGLDPHQWARAARQLGKAPSLAQLRSPGGFLRQNNDLAYTIAGSLLRWVRDERGPAALQTLYRDGDLEGALKLPLAEIERQWLAYIENPAQTPLSEADLERARARFEPAGLFDRTCALCVGRQHEQIDRARRVGQARKATALCEDLLSRLEVVGADRDLGLELTVADAEAAAGAIEPALGRLQRLPTRGSSRLQRAEVLAMQGDLQWLRGDIAAARGLWGQAALFPIAEGARRILEIKKELAQLPELRAAAGAILAYGFEPLQPERAVAELVRQAPQHPLVEYLKLRQQIRKDEGERAIEDLVALLPQIAPRWPLAAREATRLLALHLARLGRCKPLQGLDLQLEPRIWQDELRLRCRLLESAPAADGN